LVITIILDSGISLLIFYYLLKWYHFSIALKLKSQTNRKETSKQKFPEIKDIKFRVEQ